MSLRFFAVSLLIASTAFVMAACDSNGGSGPAVVTDSMQIINVTPNVGADLQTTDTSFTFTFSHPVAENEFTRTDVGPTDGNRHLIDRILLVPPQAKDLSPNGSLPLSIAFNDDRTELKITPEDSLRDGFIYTLHVGRLDDPSTAQDDGTGFYDPRFKSQDGARFAPNPNFPREQFEFSVGKNETPPAKPAVSFDPEASIASADTLEDGSLDYPFSHVTLPFEVKNIDNSAAQVKGYEVYYRSQNQAGRTGTGDRFVKADLVRPEADASDFEDADGIIPASAVSADGTLDFAVTVRQYPFSAGLESYGPIEWKMRAVSINNVRGDFSDVITTGDNTQPELEFVSDITTNQSNDVETIDVEFSESLDNATVSTSTFILRDDSGDPVDLSGASVKNVRPEDGGDPTVTLTLATPRYVYDLGEVEVNDADTSNPVTDLAGNGVDPSEDSDFF